MDDEHDHSDKPLERVQPASLTARVPDAVSAGVFATGSIVLQSPTEVMIDFVQGLANPRRIVVRVVMPQVVAVQFVEALQANLGTYQATFGRLPVEPQPVPPPDADDGPREGGAAGDPMAKQPVDEPSGGASVERAAPEATAGAAQQPIADAYDQLKAADEVLGGSYANTVSISHTGSEFHFDFIMRCFPRSIVNARVYMAAPRAPALLDSLKRSLRRS